MSKLIIIVVVLALGFGFLFWKFGPEIGRQPEVNGPLTLTIWGLKDDEKVMAPIIESYKQIKPNVTINYVKQSSLNYRPRVQAQVENGQGPDIFMIHNSWLQMFLTSRSLSPLPESVMSVADYERIFYPIAKKSFSRDNLIYAIPYEVGGLALYYNEDILKAAGVAVPRTWDEFVSAATRVSVVGSDGILQTAGAGIGSTANVDFWPDILGLLFLQQPGASIIRPDTPEGSEVLKFYTGFITDPRKKVWDVTMDSSTQAFIGGRLAFYFAPAGQVDVIRRANPALNFKTAPVPQLTSNPVSYASFWAYAVSSTSAHSQQAWDFVKFLTLPDTERLLYQEVSRYKIGGFAYSRIDLQSQLSDDPLMGAFVNQGTIYDWGYLSSGTHDQGINDGVIKYYQDAVNATLQGQDPLSALQITSQGVQKVLKDFSPNP